MSRDLLTAAAAAERLGVRRPTLYEWLGLSDHGLFVVRGRPATIEYFQGGGRGQGKILIEASEVERLKELMRVNPQPATIRRPPTPRREYPGIHVPLGRPDSR